MPPPVPALVLLATVLDVAGIVLLVVGTPLLRALGALLLLGGLGAVIAAGRAVR